MKFLGDETDPHLAGTYPLAGEMGIAVATGQGNAVTVMLPRAKPHYA
ncbi:hypothetical protein [Alcanivorax sp.]|nr:hypothetical protein [Alcanivorax sp.]